MHRVLLIDDEEGLRVLLGKELAKSGRFVVVGQADDGDTGLAEATRLQPDLILLDLKMPRVRGLKVLPDLRRACPNSKVVAFSMLDRQLHEKEALARGAAAFVDKGLEPRELLERLAEIMDGRGTRAGGPGRGGDGAMRLSGLLDWLVAPPRRRPRGSSTV